MSVSKIGRASGDAGRRMRSKVARSKVALLIGGAVAQALVLSPAGAEELRGRLKIEVTVTGEQSWTRHKDWRNGEIRERFVSEVPVMSEGDLDPYNMLDPNAAVEMQRHAAQTARRVQQIQERHGQAAPGGMGAGPAMADPAALMEIQQRAQECQGDEACLRKLAMEMMARAATGQNADIMARMQEMSAQCAQHEGAAHDACMQALAQSQSAPPDGMAPMDEEELTEPEPRYRRYHADPDCGARVEASVSRQGKGQTEDVAGMYPTKDSVEGSGTLSGPALSMICLSSELVVDEAAKTLYMRAWPAPSVEARTFVHTPPDGPMEGTNSASASAGVAEWVSDALKNVPLSGTKSTTLTNDSSDPNGTGGVSKETLNVTVSWSFVPQK